MDYLYQNDENLFNIFKLENGELMVQVKVNDFSGQFAYCIEDSNLKDYISSLEELDKSEQGEFIRTFLQDVFSFNSVLIISSKVCSDKFPITLDIISAVTSQLRCIVSVPKKFVLIFCLANISR